MDNQQDQRSCDRSLRSAVDFSSKKPSDSQTNLWKEKEPVWVQFELFFISQILTPPTITIHPLRAVKQPALASCLNCLQTPSSASSMNKGNKHDRNAEKREFRLRNAFVEEIWFPSASLKFYLRCFYDDLVGPFLEFCWKSNVGKLDFSHLPFLFHQWWLQHQGAAGFCGAAWVCRP